MAVVVLAITKLSKAGDFSDFLRVGFLLSIGLLRLLFLILLPVVHLWCPGSVQMDFPGRRYLFVDMLIVQVVH